MKKYFFLFLFLNFILIDLYFIFQNRKNIQVENIISPFIPLLETKPITYQPEKLSVEKIFLSDHSWVSTISAEKKLTLIVAGDIILARMVNMKMHQANDFTLPFEKTAPFLQTANITFADLEAPFVENCPVSGEGMIFCADPKAIEGLIFSGIDVVSLANNHLGNYGTEGIKNTQQLLNQYNIKYTGSTINVEYSNDSDHFTQNNLAIINIRGLNFAFLGYNLIGGEEQGIAFAKEEDVISDIKEAKTKSDILTVMFHWSEEYTATPSAENINLAHIAIDSGADIIASSHPHWIQSIEIYKDKPILYSLGNFIFDQEWSQKTKEGLVAKFTFYQKTLIDLELLPILIEDYNQPKFLERTEKEKILKELLAISPPKN